MVLDGGTFFASKEFVFQPPIQCSMGARKQGRKALWKSCVWFCLHGETTCFIPRTEVTKCTSCHTGSGMRMRMDWKVVPAPSPCPIKAAMVSFCKGIGFVFLNNCRTPGPVLVLSPFVLPVGNPSQSSFEVATLFHQVKALFGATLFCRTNVSYPTTHNQKLNYGGEKFWHAFLFGMNVTLTMDETIMFGTGWDARSRTIWNIHNRFGSRKQTGWVDHVCPIILDKSYFPATMGAANIFLLCCNPCTSHNWKYYSPATACIGKSTVVLAGRQVCSLQSIYYIVVSSGRSHNTNFILAGDVSRDGCHRAKVPSGSLATRWGVAKKHKTVWFCFFLVLEIMEEGLKIGILISGLQFKTAWWSMNLDWNGAWGRFCMFEAYRVFKTIDAKMPHMCWKKKQNTYINTAQLKTLDHHDPSPSGCSKQFFFPHVSQESFALSRRCGNFSKAHPETRLNAFCRMPIVVQDVWKVNLKRVEIETSLVPVIFSFCSTHLTSNMEVALRKKEINHKMM